MARHPKFIVVIGASAGGLKSVEALKNIYLAQTFTYLKLANCKLLFYLKMEYKE